MNGNGTNAEKIVGVELTKTTLNAVCLEKKTGALTELRALIKGGESLFEQIVNFVGETKKRFGAIDKLGVAVPGLVHQETKRVAFSTFVPEHEEIDFLGQLESATNLKITIENDANAAAYGEFMLGAGRGSRDLFYATLGTGIGGALIFDGKIWRGASGFAGEFGHFTINSDGMKLEDVASAANIVRRTRSRFHQDSTSSLNKFAENQIGLSDVVDEAKKGDDFALLMLTRTGGFVGAAIAGVINLLNIEKIVIGGEIMRAEHIVLEAIIRRAKEFSFAPSFAATQIVAGELGDNAAALGAALLAEEGKS